MRTWPILLLLALVVGCDEESMYSHSTGGVDKYGCDVFWMKVGSQWRINYVCFVEPNGRIRQVDGTGRIKDYPNGVLVNRLGIIIDGARALEVRADRPEGKAFLLTRDSRVCEVELDVKALEDVMPHIAFNSFKDPAADKAVNDAIAKFEQSKTERCVFKPRY